MMCVKLKGLLVFAGDNVTDSYCFNENIEQKPQYPTETFSKESQRTTSDLTESRADDVCRTKEVKGEDYTIVKPCLILTILFAFEKLPLSLKNSHFTREVR